MYSCQTPVSKHASFYTAAATRRARIENNPSPLEELDEKFGCSKLRRGVPSLHFWLIVHFRGPNLGYIANEAQLLLAIPFAVASITTILTAFVSDSFGKQAIVLLFPLTLAIAGCIIITASTNPRIKYGMTVSMARYIEGHTIMLGLLVAS
ncbi:hypothetical protein BKA67DRAFT_572725 [Truncatella angustata]|uniref:Major facilitator superfamily (MFS) profile domain-containing protein n=1 Tax=Truncatella angustata TaxID=152316 RepID=A0A9P8ZVK5_9PEZI|nr:uncharacterized protein BKA67DRAFT_572725 [Truncatella angustata]KAH6652036.1 hypothetical protein BKA67DRAFT_572725 [Truncatella angustata]